MTLGFLDFLSKSLLLYCMLYTDSPGGSIDSDAQYVIFAQITCYSLCIFVCLILLLYFQASTVGVITQ